MRVAASGGRYLAAPYRVDLNLTHRCNLACPFCYYFSPQRQFLASGKEDLPVEEWLVFLREMERLQVLTVGLCGGEAPLYDGFSKILRFLAASRMRFCLYSNGTTVGREMARQLAETRRCSYVQISLDGWETYHDQMRGKGVWSRAMAAVSSLNESGVPVHVNLVLTRNNLAGLQSFVRYVLEHYRVSRFRINPVVTDDEGLMVSAGEIWQVIRGLHDLSRRFPALRIGRGVFRYEDKLAEPFKVSPEQKCRSCYEHLSRSFAVRADGMILPCLEADGKPLGRINSGNFLDLWQSEEWEKIRRQVRIPEKMTEPECIGCRYLGECAKPCLGRTGREIRICYRDLARAREQSI